MPLNAALGRLGRLRRSHRHLTLGSASAVGIAGLCVAVALVGSAQLHPSSAQLPLLPTTQPTPTTQPAPVASPKPLAAQPVRLPTLPPLHGLIQAAVLVRSLRPLGPGVVARAVAIAHANASLAVAVGDVQLGRGRTRALAADPVKARVWTPSATARVNGVWQRAVIGEAVVAHTVAKANAVPLGGGVTVTHGSAALRLRVGAYATTQLPGIGLVVNAGLGQRLGLVPRTGVLLAVPAVDPAVVVAEVQHALGPGVTVESVLSDAVPSAGWVPPAIGPITSPFGLRIHPLTHQPKFHDGIDIGAPLGAPVYAMTSGQVLYAGPASGFGSEIILTHPGGVTTVYGHVSRILVTSGPVKAGQVIALVGSEGESTGPHLHAEVHVQDAPIDPVAWLRAHGVRFTR